METWKKFSEKLKRHLDVSVLVVPNNGTKLRRFSAGHIITIVWVYSLILVSTGYIFAVVSGGDETVEVSQTDMSELRELNKRVLNLTAEINAIKDSNRKLKSAMLLGDSTSFNEKKVSGTRKTTTKTPKEGNILNIFRHFVKNIKEIQQESYYFIKPAEGFISRGFNSGKGHFGMDIVLKTGNAIYAAANGYVAFADYTPEDGYMIIINHTDDFVTVYKHCSSLLKKQREYITQGELIALSGNTGKSSGPHLHFEIWKKGVPQDPKDYLIN
jgi:murein DD-endopeptidase MepM/ murein hydrolase activator NlpD